jgi:hypothetical protein
LGALSFLKLSTKVLRRVLRESNPGELSCTPGNGGFGMSITETTCDRATRVADNRRALQTFFGSLHSIGHAASVRPVSWVCECANPSCNEAVDASLEEYEAIHMVGAFLFIVASDDHYTPEIEQIVEHTDRYWIVEQIETQGERARRRLLEAPLSLRTW